MPRFFRTADDFRAWLEQHSAMATELVVGFYKIDSGKRSINWKESIDEALCVGWIDGVRKRIDDNAYQIRFTPRKSSSIWSAINIARVEALSRLKRMKPAGLAAFANRTEAKSRTYAYEQADEATLASADKATFRKDKVAWSFFESQAPSYRKKLIWWIVSAKQESTRQKRLARLIEASRDRRRL